MSPTVPPSSGPGDLSAALRLAWFALALPLAVLLAIGVHSGWFALTAPLARLRGTAAARALGQPTVTPTGSPPRQGPGSHPGVDPRHGPLVPLLHESAPRWPSGRAGR